MGEHRRRVDHVLDRLEEHHRVEAVAGSPNVSTAPHWKVKLGPVYLSLACSCASGLPSTPTTLAAPRASTFDP